ncbi:endolytic transglycosylase MltG [Streptomyces ficellus]|uniref:Endolytic murein transglycosylase n=1 Tax=Streptomyces ficellus TaxID=1977088 RepID=A0ABT7ZCW7_9ACTN|nr:endolytic transglycosylase MltG [Streptomyces ficellus]MDN3297293.1 endolytic transglycosylase MltG [Streptomyces ficellus]
MTEYGRSPGSQPWHPEDPAYGDQGWEGQQAYYQQTQQQPQQYEAQQDPYQQQPQQGYGDQQYHAPHDHQAAQEYQAQQAYAQHYARQPYDTGGWDTGQQTAMPYGAPAPADPYGPHAPDLYGTPEAYPPPQPPGQRRPEPEPEPEPVRHEPEPEQENHPFFSDGATDGDGDGDDGYDDEPATSRRGGGQGRRGGKQQKKRKSRNGLACLVVALVLAGGAGGVAYFGYQFWQGQFGEAPDYEGAGTGETTEVRIPRGAGGGEIGSILTQAGVVKSQGAFLSALQENPNGKSIQDGVYLLSKGMSAANAVKAMLNPASRNNLTIPEGKRNAYVYAQIDKKLKLKPGATEAVAKANAKNLGLPAWATGHPDVKDPLEGFLFPATYPLSKKAKPEDILKDMVARANTEYRKLDLEGKAKSLDLEGPWELLTVASLVNAEGKTHDDFRKMGEVVYNRLKPTNTETNQLLQFDSAFNYLMGQSEIEISESEINSNRDPYNTYTRKGLTPGPIGNPGLEALKAALNPTTDGWMYFVATDGMDKTEFAKTHEEFLKLKDKFNDNQGSD